MKKTELKKKTLEEENRVQTEKGIRWGKSNEGKVYFNRITEGLQMNHKERLDSVSRRELNHRITVLRLEIEKRESEYKKLLTRMKEGEYVDDLISQNRYTVEKLLHNKKDCEKAWETFY